MVLVYWLLFLFRKRCCTARGHTLYFRRQSAGEKGGPNLSAVLRRPFLCLLCRLEGWLLCHVAVVVVVVTVVVGGGVIVADVMPGVFVCCWLWLVVGRLLFVVVCGFWMLLVVVLWMLLVVVLVVVALYTRPTAWFSGWGSSCLDGVVLSWLNLEPVPSPSDMPT